MKRGELWMSSLTDLVTTVVTDVKIDVRPRTGDVAAGSVALARRRERWDRRLRRRVRRAMGCVRAESGPVGAVGGWSDGFLE